MSTFSYGGRVTVSDEREPMTIYDLLRKLMADQPWTEDERREAAALITELERNNVLGTRAGQLTTEDVHRQEVP